MLGAVVSTELESKEKRLNKDVTSENSSSEDDSSSDSDESSTETRFLIFCDNCFKYSAFVLST